MSDQAGGRRGYSLKALLAGVLLIASLPGVILGGLTAQRAYVAASEAERAGVTQTARLIANRIEEVVSGSRILAESLAQQPQVRQGADACNPILESAASQSERFSAIVRLDAQGRVLCASRADRLGASWRDAPWREEALGSNRALIAPAWIEREGAEQSIPLTAPILVRDRTTGLVVVLLRATWLINQAVADVEGPDASQYANATIVMFDASGAPFALGAGVVEREQAIAAAQRAIAGEPGDFGSLQTGVSEVRGGGFRVVVVAPKASGAIGLRAGLITAAPLIAVALAMAAVWIALHRLVMRWIDGMVESAHSAAAGAYEPANLTHAPEELKLLGAAFDDAVRTASERAGQLQQELARNLALSRELHHRVKNNIQVIMSALSRQLRRSSEPTARYALSEARARLLPIALTYRYTARPEDVTRIDLSGYLGELARQIHTTLEGAARGVELRIECDPLTVSHEEAATIGMITGECLTSAYLSSIGMSSAPFCLLLKMEPDETMRLECGVMQVNPSHNASKLDEALMLQLARQIGAELTIELGPRFVLAWPAANRSVQPA